MAGKILAGATSLKNLFQKFRDKARELGADLSEIGSMRP
jgi:hypothetical protein